MEKEEQQQDVHPGLWHLNCQCTEWQPRSKQAVDGGQQEGKQAVKEDVQPERVVNNGKQQEWASDDGTAAQH